MVQVGTGDWISPVMRLGNKDDAASNPEVEERSACFVRVQAELVKRKPSNDLV